MFNGTEATFKILTWNVLHAQFDGTKENGNKIASWSQRVKVVTSMIKKADPDVITVNEADDWWGHCVGYPGRSDTAAFRSWIKAHQVHTQLFANAYPGATVQDVREALAAREQIVAFAAETHGLDAAALQQRFLAEFA